MTTAMTTMIVVGSIKGTGGATATSLGLAAAAGELTPGAVMVESDPSGGSLLGWSEHLNATRPSLYDAASQQRPRDGHAATRSGPRRARPG